MNTKNQLICAWAGVAFLLLFFIGLWPVAKFFPPHSPTASAAEIAAIYQQDTTVIRLGMLIMMVAAALQLPFAAAISMQLKRIEGPFPVMAYTQLGAGALAVFILTVPVMVFIAATFRPERAIEMTQLLNDLGWLLFVMPFGPAVIQSLAIGLAILSDKSPKPVFPRWLAFFNFWVAVLFLPGGMIPFFKTGPFAWNGVIAFWIPAGVFGVWFIVMFPMLLKAIKSQAASE